MSARIDFMPMSLLSENRTEYYQFSIRNYVFVREERINLISYGINVRLSRSHYFSHNDILGTSRHACRIVSNQIKTDFFYIEHQLKDISLYGLAG